MQQFIEVIIVHTFASEASYMVPGTTSGVDQTSVLQRMQLSISQIFVTCPLASWRAGWLTGKLPLKFGCCYTYVRTYVRMFCMRIDDLLSGDCLLAIASSLWMVSGRWKGACLPVCLPACVQLSNERDDDDDDKGLAASIGVIEYSKVLTTLFGSSNHVYYVVLPSSVGVRIFWETIISYRK